MAAPAANAPYSRRSMDSPFSPGSLLQGAWELLRAHPLPLVLPLVVMGLLTAGEGPAYGSNPFAPWWFFPFFLALALVAVLIGLLLIVVQVALGLTTMEAARLALDRGGAPDLGEGWRSVRWHLTEGRFGQSLSRAWRLTEGHRGNLLLALLVLIVAQIIVSILVSWLPVVGTLLRGAVSGLFSAAWVVTLGVYYHRRLAMPAAAQAP